MRHKPLIFTTIFLLINVLSFLSVFYYRINASYVSINIVLSMAQGNMIGIENTFLRSSIYLFLTSIIIYKISDSAKDKLELFIIILLILFTSLPFLNFNGV